MASTSLHFAHAYSVDERIEKTVEINEEVEKLMGLDDFHVEVDDFEPSQQIEDRLKRAVRDPADGEEQNDRRGHTQGLAIG